MDDSKIVDLYLQRDERAIELTAEKYGERIKNLAKNIVEDENTAEECENDTYLKAWDSIPPHEPRTYLFSFLAKITRQLCLDRCRAQNRIKRNINLVELTAEMELCLPSSENVEKQMDAKLMGSLINSFLKQLPEDKRNMFIRRYWFMDSISDISKRYSLKESAVKTKLHRLRNQLKDYLTKEGYSL